MCVECLSSTFLCHNYSLGLNLLLIAVIQWNLSMGPGITTDRQAATNYRLPVPIPTATVPPNPENKQLME